MPNREKVLLALEHHKGTAVCNGCPYAEDDDTHEGYCPVYDDAIALLKEQPEIVRCKDCKHWGTNDCSMYNLWSNVWGDDEPTPDEWFCPIGERR